MTRNKVCPRWQQGAALLVGLHLLLWSSPAGDFPPEKYAVQLSATIQESPAKITLTWPGDPDTQKYTVAKRTLDSDWQELGTLSGSTTSFEDTNIQVGKPYEYRLVKYWADTYEGYGYIRSGIKVPLVDTHGKVLLLIENSIASNLGPELDQLERDLIGDGWGVVRQTVSASDSPRPFEPRCRLPIALIRAS